MIPPFITPALQLRVHDAGNGGTRWDLSHSTFHFPHGHRRFLFFIFFLVLRLRDITSQHCIILFAREHIACMHRIAYSGVCLGWSLEACGFLFFSFVGDKTEAFVFGFGFGLCVFMLLLLCWLLLVWL